MMHSCVHHFIVTADRGGANANYVILYTAGYRKHFFVDFYNAFCIINQNLQSNY